jgi:hypothetical protein
MTMNVYKDENILFTTKDSVLITFFENLESNIEYQINPSPSGKKFHISYKLNGEDQLKLGVPEYMAEAIVNNYRFEIIND